VTLSADVVPEVSVWSPTADSVAGPLKLNVNSKLILDGSCKQFAADSQDGVALSWSFSPPLEGSPVLSSPASFNSLLINSRAVFPSGQGLFIPGQLYTASLRCTTPCLSFSPGSSYQSCAVTGTASLSVYVNQPPAGGSFAACLSASSGVCVKTGIALTSRFTLSCLNFADDEPPLEFQFGWEVEGSSGGATIYSYTPSAAINLVLPAGRIIVTARVRDSLGGETDALSDTLTVSYPNNGGVKRRALPALANLEAAAGLVDEALRQGRADLVNRQIAPLASELAMSAWQPAAGAPLSSNSTAQSAEFIRMLMISKAADAAKKVVSSEEFLCEAVGVVAILTVPFMGEGSMKV
jgi:hypothetical protein